MAAQAAGAADLEELIASGRAISAYLDAQLAKETPPAGAVVLGDVLGGALSGALAALDALDASSSMSGQIPDKDGGPQKGRYIIDANGQRHWLAFYNNREDFQNGSFAQESLVLTDKQVRAYLSFYKNNVSALSDKATELGLISTIALVGAKSMIGASNSMFLGLEGLNASHIASLYDGVFTDYVNQSRTNGLYLIIQTTNVSPGWGAAVSYQGTNVQFYYPEGSLFKQITYSEH